MLSDENMYILWWRTPLIIQMYRLDEALANIFFLVYDYPELTLKNKIVKNNKIIKAKYWLTESEWEWELELRVRVRVLHSKLLNYNFITE